jgi:Tfp pilus assembly protein PilX
MILKALRNESGVALLIALSLALVISGMAMAIVAVSVTERGISQNERVAAQALYKADAAIEVAKQQMAVFSQAKMESLRSVWPGTGPIITSPTTFFPGEGLSFHDEDLNLDVAATFTFADSELVSTSQTFNFHYVAMAQGAGTLGSDKSVASEGTLRLSASRGNFADYLIFTDIHLTPSGSQIWFYTSGHFDGRVHSNDKLRFAQFPTFEDLVTSHASVASYYNNGRPRDLDADRNGSIDVPNFYGGFERSADEVDLPANSYSQERAALGLAATDTTAVPLATKKTMLGMDPTDPSAIPNGIYVPNDGAGVTGGIYIVGNSSNFRLTVNADGLQQYELTDAASVTKRIVLDKYNNQTKVYTGTTDSTIYSGLPRGIAYCTGGISNLGGGVRVDGAPPAAIEGDTKLTITAVGDISLDRDITYEDYTGADCVLGLYSSNGNIRITTAAPSNLMLDAYLIASGANGAVLVDSYDRGSYRGQVHLRGGCVQRYYGAFGTFDSHGNQTGYGRDFKYDRRGMAPPYYPLTSVFKVDSPVPHTSTWREV